MIARKQKISRQLNELIDAPPAGESCPSRPSANIAGSPSLEELPGFSRFNCARVIVVPHGALLGPTVGALATANQTRAGGLERRPARHFSGDFVHRRNARFPRMEESNRANVAWSSPAKLLEIQISGKVHFFSPRVGSRREPFSCLLPKVTHISLYKHALP